MVITSEEKLPLQKGETNYVFLAGSIGTTGLGNWRQEVIKEIGDRNVILDPTNLNHDKLSDADMKLHIQWELDALSLADKILLNFLPDSKSPISLVELGLYVASNKLTVVCPKSFYKSRYVYTLCEKYNTPIFETITKALAQF